MSDSDKPGFSKRIGTTAGIYARHGAKAADAYAATTGSNPNGLGARVAKEEGRTAGFLYSDEGEKKDGWF